MGTKKKSKRRRKYSSSSSSSESESSSSSSSSNSSGSSRTSRDEDAHAAPASASRAPPAAGLDAMSAMFLDTKPEDLIDQIFIILDETEIKDLCPTILKHMSVADIKEKALSCVQGLDDAGLESLFVEQEPDPGAEEIDKALIQLGLVGNTTTLSIDREPSKWKSVEEAQEVGSQEIYQDLEGDYGEHPVEEAPPKRKLLEEASPEPLAEDADIWRALLLRDKAKMSETLGGSDIIANNLSDKPRDFVPAEAPVRRRGEEEAESDHSSTPRPSSPHPSSPPAEEGPIGNPLLAPGNPPLAESPAKPRLSYRARAAAAARDEETEEDRISAGDISSGSSGGQSSSSEEGEISDEEEGGGKGSDAKGSDAKGSDDKGSNDKVLDDKGSDDKGSNDKVLDDKGSEDDKELNDKRLDKKESDDKGSDDKGSDAEIKDSDNTENQTDNKVPDHYAL